MKVEKWVTIRDRSQNPGARSQNSESKMAGQILLLKKIFLFRQAAKYYILLSFPVF